jgi:PAS domain S-box-containing protein
MTSPALTGLASIRTLEHVRPGAFRRWVVAGLLLGTAGYGVGISLSVVMEPGRWGPRIPEIATFALGVVGLWLAHRGRTRIGGTLFLAAIYAEVHASFFVYGVLGSSLVIAPTLVLASGLFLGAPAALVLGVLSLLLVVAGAAFEPVSPGVTAQEVEQIVYYAFTVMGTAVLTALGIRLFAAVASAAEASRARTQDLVAHAPDGILVVSPEGRVLEANPSAARILSRDQDSLLGGYVEELGLERLRGESTGSPTTLEVTAADGEPRYVEANSRRLPDRSGSERIQVMLRDATERIRSEANERARTEQLQRNQRLAVVGTLAGGIAHDFNNLLTVIRGSAELIRFEGGPEMQDLAAEILAAEARGAALIRQLLVFARRGEGSPRAVNASEEVGRMEPLLLGLLGKRVRLVLRLRAEGLIFMDPAHLEQIVVSLVANAREACPGGGEVRVEAADDVHGGRPHVRVTVADRGEGMSDAVREQMFDPFFTTRELQHAGLGLSAVHALVDQWDGTIGVETEPGVGTAVDVWWPTLAAGRAAPNGFGAASEGIRAPDQG